MENDDFLEGYVLEKCSQKNITTTTQFKKSNDTIDRKSYIMANLCRFKFNFICYSNLKETF